jgi:hypothetical protein
MGSKSPDIRTWRESTTSPPCPRRSWARRASSSARGRVDAAQARPGGGRGSGRVEFAQRPGNRSQGGHSGPARWAFATPPEPPLARRRRCAAPPRSAVGRQIPSVQRRRDEYGDHRSPCSRRSAQGAAPQPRDLHRRLPRPHGPGDGAGAHLRRPRDRRRPRRALVPVPDDVPRLHCAGFLFASGFVAGLPGRPSLCARAGAGRAAPLRARRRLFPPPALPVVWKTAQATPAEKAISSPAIRSSSSR